MLKKLTAAIALCVSFNLAHGADVNELAKYASIDAQDISDAMSKATYQQKIIDAMTKPYEGKPWWKYRKLFITTSRIEAGINFYLENEKTLQKAYEIYGVNPQYICAIIGVETFYGKNMGTWSVLDALYTLGFHYPPREAYFSKEFANFVKLAKRENWNLTAIKGSYAGAMGMGQFMPSSYLNYAIDFDGNNKVDIFYSVEDAIGSVANYFKAHGWVKDGAVFYPALATSNVDNLIKKEWKLKSQDLYQNGINTKEYLDSDQTVRLFKFDLQDGKVGYGVGLNNFNTIMRYNKSPLYARAVFELADFIQKGYLEKKNNLKQTN